ncbi:MAG: hypothetical protein ACNA8W_24255, partial [Bradymonadaceae bacterium]
MRKFIILLTALVLAAIMAPTLAIAALPGLTGISPVCLNALRQATNTQPYQCTTDADCVNQWQCYQYACHSPADAQRLKDEARARELGKRLDEPVQKEAAPTIAAHRTPTADELCSADRRCRIERLKSNNRARRQGQVFDDEKAVQSVVRDFHDQKTEATVRLAKPWTVDFVAAPLGWGFAGGYSFSSLLRAEAGFMRNSSYIYYFDDSHSLSGYH